MDCPTRYDKYFRHIYFREEPKKECAMKTIYVKEIARKTMGRLTAGKEVSPRQVAVTVLFLCAMFVLGRAAARTLMEIRETVGQGVNQEAVPDGDSRSGDLGTARSTGTQDGDLGAAQSTGTQGADLGTAQEAAQTTLLAESGNWGLGFGKSGEKPTGNATVAEMKQYNAYYMAEGEDKVLYLTFDCGYENGNTAPILDALKKHNAPATFFVVGHFLESAPDIAKRMVEEGHTVGNHTYHHPDMSKISDQASFQQEMDTVRDKFREVTGAELSMYYRPPQGKYSTANLQMAKDMGYATFFWSLAYVDWNKDAQPSHEEAFEKLCGRVHPGAIVLLHSTSQTNGEILDELLSKWEEMGYTFRPLSDFVEGAGSTGSGTGTGSAKTQGAGTQDAGGGRILQDERNRPGDAGGTS